MYCFDIKYVIINSQVRVRDLVSTSYDIHLNVILSIFIPCLWHVQKISVIDMWTSEPPIHSIHSSTQLYTYINEMCNRILLVGRLEKRKCVYWNDSDCVTVLVIAFTSVCVCLCLFSYITFCLCVCMFVWLCVRLGSVKLCEHWTMFYSRRIQSTGRGLSNCVCLSIARADVFFSFSSPTLKCVYGRYRCV